MKQYIYLIFAFFCVLIAGVSCNNDSYPDNPTIVSPISALVLSVEGMDYVAVPKLTDDKVVDHTLSIEVRKPSTKAIVKSIVLADAGTSINIAEGDEVSFIDNKLPLTLTKGTISESYLVKMVFNPPPFMYFVKSSDYGPNGDRYYLDVDHAQKLASVDYNDKFEGYIDLTGTNWDNIGLVESGLASYFDYNGGLTSAQTSASYTMAKKAALGGNVFPCDGPWGDWITKNGNEEIVSPGIWKINFNAGTGVMSLLETQWAITGSATNALKAMTYSSSAHQWSLDADLSTGSLKFTTIAVSAGDQVVTYGASEGLSKLSESGKAIEISSAGNYNIVLDLSNSPYYNYSITKK